MSMINYFRFVVDCSDRTTAEKVMDEFGEKRFNSRIVQNYGIFPAGNPSTVKKKEIFSIIIELPSYNSAECYDDVFNNMENTNLQFNKIFKEVITECNLDLSGEYICMPVFYDVSFCD